MRKKSYLSIGLSVGFIASYGLLSNNMSEQEPDVAFASNVSLNEVEQPKQSSLTLHPGMYIPPESLFVNQQVNKYDVERAMEILKVKELRTEALASFSLGVMEHTGFAESDLSEDLVNKYNEIIISYMDRFDSEFNSNASYEELDITLSNFSTELTKFTVDAIQYKESKEKRVAEETTKSQAEEVVLLEESNIQKDNPISFALPQLGEEYLTYMSYKAITAQTTPHWRLQQVAKTNEDGYRTYAGALCVALASSFGTEIGTLYEITFEDGKVMKAILADNKSDKHTDAKKQYRDSSGKYDGSSGNIVEMLMDTSKFADMYETNKKINSDFPDKVKSIVRVGKAGGF